jgi:hypothetical protein
MGVNKDGGLIAPVSLAESPARTRRGVGDARRAAQPGGERTTLTVS